MTDAQIESRRRGGRTRAASFTAKYQSDAAKAGAAKRDMGALGLSGYKATVAKLGYRGWLNASRQTRLAHPSALEQAVAAILDSMGIAFERDAFVLEESDRPLTVDFLLADRRVVEAYGRPHFLPALNHGCADGRRAADEARFIRLRAAGYNVLIIDYRALDRAQADITGWLEMA